MHLQKCKDNPITQKFSIFFNVSSFNLQDNVKNWRLVKNKLHNTITNSTTCMWYYIVGRQRSRQEGESLSLKSKKYFRLKDDIKK